MRVTHSHILEERKFQDKYIICYIEVANRYVEYYHGQCKHQTHRWMLPEYWAKFDAKLEALLNGEKCSDEDFKERTFYLNELISVKVKNSKIPVDVLKQCIRNSNKCNTTMGLEFLIEYRESNKRLKEKQEKNVSSEPRNKLADHHEYEPSFVSNNSNNLSVPVPYTPSVKVACSPNDNNTCESLSELDHEEPYSPKPLSECSPDKNSQNPPIPLYKPMQVTRKESSTMHKEDDDVPETSEHTEIEENNCSTLENSQRKVKYRDKNGKSSDNMRRDRENRDRHKEKYSAEDKHTTFDDNKTKRAPKDSKEKSEAEILLPEEDKNNHDNISVEKSEKRKRNLTDFSENPPQLKPRRSSRSPNKPKRYLDTCVDTKDISEKNRSGSKHKSTKNTRDLFGSDNDDDDNQNDDFDDSSPAKKSSKKSLKNCMVNTISKPTITESTKKKKKHEDKSNYKNKNNLDKWLEKKSTSKLKEGKARSSSLTSSPEVETKIKKRKESYCSPIHYLSKEEMEEQMVNEKVQMEKNRVLKEVLESVVGPPPVRVETLSIEDLSENEVLDSFKNYKTKLDKVFRKNSKNMRSIKGHDGINHIFVIKLIEHKIQLKMLNKLSSVYEPDSEGGPAHLSLYANAMLPEWILCLFMDRHNLTRDEAIKHIKAQEEYNLHLEAQMENSMLLC